MVGIFFESLPFGSHAILVAILGFALACWPRVKRPARAGTIVVGVAFGVMLLGYFVFPLVSPIVLGPCREPVGRAAVSANIIMVMISASCVAFGSGMWPGALWRAERKIFALVLLALICILMVMFTYLASFGAAMSSYPCLS